MSRLRYERWVIGWRRAIGGRIDLAVALDHDHVGDAEPRRRLVGQLVGLAPGRPADERPVGLVETEHCRAGPSGRTSCGLAVALVALAAVAIEHRLHIARVAHRVVAPRRRRDRARARGRQREARALVAGVRLCDSWQPRQPRYRRASRRRSCAWFAAPAGFRPATGSAAACPAGAWNATEPSASIGTVPSTRFTPSDCTPETTGPVEM